MYCYAFQSIHIPMKKVFKITGALLLAGVFLTSSPVFAQTTTDGVTTTTTDYDDVDDDDDMDLGWIGLLGLAGLLGLRRKHETPRAVSHTETGSTGTGSTDRTI